MKQNWNTSAIVKVMIFVVAVAVLYLLHPHRDSSFPYLYKEGQRWEYKTLVAPFDFPIYKSDSRLQYEQAEALRDYAPCFKPIGSSASLLVVSVDDMHRIQQGGYDHIAVISHRHMASNIPTEHLMTPKEAFLQHSTETAPTLQYDSIMSNQIYTSLIESVSPTEGAVMRGEEVIKSNQIITADDFLKLESLRRAYSEQGLTHIQHLTSEVSQLLLSLLIVFAFVFYLIVFRRPLWEQMRALLFFVLLMTMIAGGAMVLLHYARPLFIFLIPFAWVPILVRVFYDSRTAFMLHLTTIMLVATVLPNPYLFLMVQIAAGMVAIDALKDLTRRSQLAVAAAYILITYALIYTLTVMIATGDWTQLNWRAYIFFVINAGLVIGVYSLIFLFEKVFRLLSSITLVELCDINSELMHSFSEQAPGTFQHSLQVSSLASDAAKSIGAKALLVRTGALYHDIGKMAHPEWFIENQSGGPNPLLEMSNPEAAKAVISHTIEGERIAREYHLPEVLINFIRSHHGTSLVRYFYNSEVNRLREAHFDDTMLNEKDYQYAGPLPQSKEAAILMMADAIEARSRSLDSYTEQSINDMVEQMIATQIQSGQFAESNLSFRDLERVKQSFKQRLMTIYHHRIKYPAIKQQ